MPSLGDISSFMFACVAVASFVKTVINGRKTDALAREQTLIKTDMRELAVNTNSIKDALVAASYREGKADQAAENRK